MLILSRRKGQIVDIGPVAITVEAIDRTGISIRVQCPADTRLQIGMDHGTACAPRNIEHHGEALINMPRSSALTIATPAGLTEIRGVATPTRPGTVRLSFTAPKHIAIWRRELTLRGAA